MKMIIIASFIFAYIFSGSGNSVSKEHFSILSDTSGVCPVTGDKLSVGSPTFRYIDKDITFCNDGCVMAFKKEPANYLKGGIMCMPCGEDDSNKNISAVHNGVKYYFCGKGCKSKFESDAEKYLNEHKK